MIRKPLTCPTCGDTWKRVISESFVRLGPPMHECRACWTPFATGEKEWQNLDSTSRIGYFLQNILFVLPLFVMVLIALVMVTFVMGMVEMRDALDYFIWSSVALAVLFAGLTLRSAAMILLSKRRIARGPAPVRRATPEPALPEVPHYPQGRPNPRPENPEDHRGWPL